MTQTFGVRTLEQLSVDDEATFQQLPLYASLKSILVRSAYRFRVLPPGNARRWDRALLLNLTFWGGNGGDVLPDESIAADVVGHVAWHHLATRAFSAPGVPLSADALFVGEAIASAFDLYLVGHLLTRTSRRKRSSFLETQVPAMAETAQAAGTSAQEFEVLLASIAEDPARAFEDLRSLLVDVSTGLLSCVDPADGLAVLQRFGDHRLAPLLHRFELSNWVLWVRAWGADRSPDARVRAVDRTLREQADPMAWLVTNWVTPALAD